MSPGRHPTLRRTLAAASAVALVSGLVLAPSASAAPAAPDQGYQPAQKAPTKTGYSVPAAGAKIASTLQDLRKDASKTAAVYVQFAGDGAVAAAPEDPQSKEKVKASAAQKASAKTRRAAIKKTADNIVGVGRKAAGRSAAAIKPLYTTVNSLPGVAVTANAAAIDAIAARPDVVKVSRIVSKKPNNAGAAQFTKVLNAWQSTGLLGDGVRVGIIDTGIDYTHADFGGPGTTAAFEKAQANSAGPWTPNEKVVGGYDFAGDDYNADPSSPSYQPVPKPDPNPLDCQGHGSHVAGTVAGYGVNADGSTFKGDYSALNADALYKMKVGPGMAPAAKLYGLRVFGCGGSTDLTGAALDWSLDPNGDGDFSDHLDIVNLSLGSDFGPEDDPDNALIDVLAENGVLPVLAMGNAGDNTDAGGTPGNAVRSLAVASVVDPYIRADALKATAPANLAKNYAGQMSVAYPWASKPPVSGTVVNIPGANADGCDPLSAADKARVAGKVAWLEWDDNDATRRCGSAGRSNNVAAAGAIGAIFTSQLDVFGAGITGSATIPVFQLYRDGTEALRPAMEAGTLQVTFDGSLEGSIAKVNSAIGDMPSSFTSRGPHNSINPIKPDVAAPGDTIVSAAVGTGDAGASNSGTSMATPHTAGIAALVKQRNPGWTTEQLKADIMNTAAHDVFDQQGQKGNKYGPARVGAGRVDALNAVNNTVLAYSAGRAGAVSASFGVVMVPANKKSVTKTQKVTVENTARTGATMKVSYDPVVQTPGVNYSVSPASLYLPPRGKATVTVTMSVTTAQLAHTIDPTMSVTQTNPLTGMDEARQYVTDASGRILLSQAGKDALRVPVYGVAKPYSTTKATKGQMGRQKVIQLNGKGFNDGYTSLVSALELGATSPKLPTCTGTQTSGCTTARFDGAGDIKEVGAGVSKGATGVSDGFLWFGVSAYQDWVNVGHITLPYVDIDTNGDGRPEFEVYAQAMQNASGDQLDLIEAITVDLRTGRALSVTPINFNYGDVDTGAFDSNVILLPIDPAVIGITAQTKDFPMTYTTGVYSAWTGEDIDTVGPVAFNPLKPAVSFEAPLYIDEGKSAIPYTMGYNAPRKTSVLVLHLNGKPGARSEVITVK
ncbi:S8 family serine peptidase [Nakamurella aerolata]|uniref:S8 family serine peptidase n=1 Tax=Nakamurella aerolata TaxID=1656892 RepID=A0A849A6J0_9ACTN|nr:S8 family serine peptidase [Nakamurella aerolata]NNG36594.1 S8 family serine peptidase [Nakamurella aerolata]